MTPAPYTEDTLVQQTTAEYLEQKLSRESVYAYKNEDFGPDSLLGKESDRENKQLQKTAKKETALICSSAAEYLTFVAAAGSGQTSVEMRYEDENIWLTQKMLAMLYDVTVSAVNQHLKRIFADNELQGGFSC